MTSKDCITHTGNCNCAYAITIKGTPAVSISATSPVAEGDPVTVTATLSEAFSSDLEIPLTFSHEGDLGTAEDDRLRYTGQDSITYRQKPRTRHPVRGRFRHIDDDLEEDDPSTFTSGDQRKEVHGFVSNDGRVGKPKVEKNHDHRQ